MAHVGDIVLYYVTQLNVDCDSIRVFICCNISPILLHIIITQSTPAVPVLMGKIRVYKKRKK